CVEVPGWVVGGRGCPGRRGSYQAAAQQGGKNRAHKKKRDGNKRDSKKLPGYTRSALQSLGHNPNRSAQGASSCWA
nr:hypothetical protein [Tanacetum cinerariifolium]